MNNKQNTTMDKLISLCKRRGFIFPSGEKYGGLQGFWDFGPLGVELKNNIKKAWWKKFVQEKQDIVGLDATIITNPTVWVKSGHVEKFQDALVECKSCHMRFKADDIGTTYLKDEKSKERMLQSIKEGSEKDSDEIFDKNMDEVYWICPQCDKRNFHTNIIEFQRSVRKFNTMLRTFVGPVEDSAHEVYLRPETAQNIFINFDNVRQATRQRLPFGIAQIGKAFRNEITPGNFIFRSREFEMMEIEYFINPKEDDKWFKQWVEDSYNWFIGLGIKKDNLRLFEQPKAELAHYSKATTDIEYKFPFDKGFAELMGIANRTDFDLKAHGFTYKDDLTKEEFVPYVIEPSAGVDRAALAFLLDAYDEVKGGRTTTTESNKEEEVVLRLHKDLAPYKVAVLPLSKKEQLSKVALNIYHELQPHFMTAYDDVASIGRRYRRQDEIGTPYCVTVDFDSLEDKKVTVRDRDTMKQERIAIGELIDYLKNCFKG